MHSVHGPGSRLSTFLYSCIRRIVVYDASLRAYCSIGTTNQRSHEDSGWWRQRSRIYLRPMQIRGPPLKGRYSHPALNVSQRSGLKSSASLPKRSSRRCMAYRFQPTVVFAGMKMGELPSGPPPRGRTVSAIDIRVLNGTTGCRRSAVELVSNQSRYKSTACPPDHPNAVGWRRTFVDDILEILHVFDLFECRLLPIQGVHLPP